VGAEALAERVLAGERRALARAITLVERGDAGARELIRALFPRTGRAHLVGVTGSGGAGKSSLIAGLAGEWRRRGRTVGVVAVDPTSAGSGGALLGDRVRMERLLGDPGVFVRSMATRGGSGGLARATIDAARVLDAAGFEVVVVETIGAGQDQIDVARAVETVLVVEAPNMGDDVQTLKAGLFEVADLYVVGKADLPGADRTAAALRAMLSLEPEHDGWRPPVLKTSAATGEGVAALADAIDQHVAWSAADPVRHRRRAEARARYELERLLREELLRQMRDRLGEADLIAAASAIAERRDEPYAAVGRLTQRVLRERGPARRHIELVERDGDEMSFFAVGPRGFVELLANVTVEGDTLVLRRAHVQGVGPGSQGVAELRTFARMLGRYFGVRRIIVYGAERASGTRIGRTPRPIVFKVG
jgi:LAO/AO transport system kinase